MSKESCMSKVARDGQKNPATSPIPGSSQSNITPFEFLDGITPDLINIIHAVILSGLSPYDKHDICMKVVKHPDVWGRYMDWKKKICKTPPPSSLDNLPWEIRQTVKTQLEYLEYDKVKEICRQYPRETVELKKWLDTFLDQKDPMKYLEIVFDRARIILDEYLKNGKVPQKEPEKIYPNISQELKMVPAEEPPVAAPRNLTPPSTTMNILLLGETGMGKTTFINSMVNQLQYSFDQLMAHDQPKILVNTSFTVYNPTDHKTKMVAVVADEKYRLDGNEIESNGQSSTQSPVTYKYSWMDGKHEKILRIIDTPGVNDTRGAAQDDTNFNLILRHAQKMGKIDAVCVLMKPNETKFSQPFRYCFNNLLLRLHRTATKNIIFCFTHCRSTMYKPGDSLNTLQAYLEQVRSEKGIDITANKSNIFCFDNDCFRYILTAKVFPNQRTDDDDKVYSEGWAHNAIEIKRFLGKVKDVPVNEQLTTEEKKARRLIEKLAPTVCEAVVNLEEMKRTQEEHLEKIDKLMKKEQKNFEEHKKPKREMIATIEAKSAFILNACVQLSVFLNYHSTFTEEDPFKKAMDICVKREEEQQKTNKKKNSLLAYTLAAIGVEHVDNVKRAIERVQANTHAPLTVEEVHKLVSNLAMLKISGKQIASIK